MLSEPYLQLASHRYGCGYVTSNEHIHCLTLKDCHEIHVALYHSVLEFIFLERSLQSLASLLSSGMGKV